MPISLDIRKPEVVLELGTWLLYILLGIDLFMIWGSFGNPRTYTFISAVVCLIIPTLFFLKDDEHPFNENKKSVSS